MPYLQEADSRSVVDLDVGGISAWQQLAVTEPRNEGARVSESLAGDVSRITLPGEHRRRALDLWSICNYSQCQPSATKTWTIPKKDLGAKNMVAYIIHHPLNHLSELQFRISALIVCCDCCPPDVHFG